MEILAFAVFTALVVAWIALPVRATAVEGSEEQAA